MKTNPNSNNQYKKQLPFGGFERYQLFDEEELSVAFEFYGVFLDIQKFEETCGLLNYYPLKDTTLFNVCWFECSEGKFVKIDDFSNECRKFISLMDKGYSLLREYHSKMSH